MLHNVERSAFRRGEYIGYARGVWRIRRTNSTYGKWIAWYQEDASVPAIYGFTLSAVSARLEDFAAKVAA